MPWSTAARLSTASDFMPLPDNPGLALIGQPGAAPAPPTPGQRTVVADANYSAVATDRYIALTSITANRTITLPIPSAFPVGTLLVIQDESRSLRPSIALTIQGGGTINGLASLYIDQPNAALYLWSDGVAKWSAFALNLGKVVQALGDASTSLDAGVDTVILTAALTAPRILTMQNLATGRYVAGQTVTVFDPAGFASSANTLSARRGGTNTINGATADVVILNAPRQKAELTVDNTGTNWGTTASASGGAAVVQQVGDTNATINAGTTVVALTTALTAPRVLTLPTASGYTAGNGITIIDPKGVVSQSNGVSIARAGADTINGAAANVTMMQAPRQTVAIQVDSTGTNWGTQGAIMINPVLGSLGGAAEIWLGMAGQGCYLGTCSGGNPNSITIWAAFNRQILFGGGIVSMSSTVVNGFSSLDCGNAAMDTGWARNAAGVVEFNNGTAGAFRDIKIRSLLYDRTIIAAGTTGPQTINKGAGSIRIAAAGTTVTLTNSLVVAGTKVRCCQLQQNDATAKSCLPTITAGQIVFTLNAAATAEVEIYWEIAN